MFSNNMYEIVQFVLFLFWKEGGSEFHLGLHCQVEKEHVYFYPE